MTVTMQQLKMQPDKVFSRINKGQEMNLSYKGKVCAKIVPFNVKFAEPDESENELFGIWKDRRVSI